MSKRARATISSHDRYRFEREVGRKLQDVTVSPRGRLLLEMLCHALPVGAVVLDAQERIVFANNEALHVLSLWRSAGARAHPKKEPIDALLPPEITGACDRLKHEFTRRSSGRRTERANFGARVRVRHPDRPVLSAV